MTTSSGYTVLADRIVVFHKAIVNPSYLIELADESGWESNKHEDYDDGVPRRFESSISVKGDIADGRMVLESLTSALNEYADVIGSTIDESNYAVGSTWDAYVSKYNVGGRANPHTDEGFTEDNGIYTVIAYLNDSYEGGEVSFVDQGVSIKQAAGDVLIFPSYYLHYSDPVLSGDKYMVVFRLRY